MSEKLEAPSYLSEKSKKLWASVVATRARSPEKLELVCVALKNLDFADECEKIIKKEGLTITTPKSGCSHLHPLFKSMKESQQLFIKIWISLGFKFDPAGPVQRWP